MSIYGTYIQESYNKYDLESLAESITNEINNFNNYVIDEKVDFEKIKATVIDRAKKVITKIKEFIEKLIAKIKSIRLLDRLKKLSSAKEIKLKNDITVADVDNAKKAINKSEKLATDIANAKTDEEIEKCQGEVEVVNSDYEDNKKLYTYTAENMEDLRNCIKSMFEFDAECYRGLAKCAEEINRSSEETKRAMEKGWADLNSRKDDISNDMQSRHEELKREQEKLNTSLKNTSSRVNVFDDLIKDMEKVCNNVEVVG